MKNDVLPAVFAIFSLFVLTFMLTAYWSSYFAKTKMWQEAEKRGYAVQVEHSGGTGYKWKDE